MNPCDYLIWGFMKDNVYRNNPQTAEELRSEIMAAVSSISEETLVAVMENLSRCLQMVLDAVTIY
jgi:hypothetical protein